MLQKSFNAVTQFLQVLCLAFPDNQDRPSQVFQIGDISVVSQDSSIKLVIPEILVGKWTSTSRTVMLVPEAPVNKDDFTTACECQIRFPRQATTMKAIPKAQFTNKVADSHFWSRIFPSDTTHYTTTEFGRKMICHKRQIMWETPLWPTQILPETKIAS